MFIAPLTHALVFALMLAGVHLAARTDYKVAAGTSLSIEVRTDLDSQTAQLGDQVDGRLTLALFSGAQEVVPVSSPIYGAVTAVRPASRDEKGQIEIRFSTLEHPETHSRVGIRATPIIVDAPPDPPKKRFQRQQHYPARLARGTIVHCSLLDPFVVRLQKQP